MQGKNKSAREKIDYIIDAMIKYFGNRFESYGVFDVYDDEHDESFSIKFMAYQYFPMVFRYGRGRMGFAIYFQNNNIPLKTSQKWWDTADIDILFAETKRDLELRIPDKFLADRGWL